MFGLGLEVAQQGWRTNLSTQVVQEGTTQKPWDMQRLTFRSVTCKRCCSTDGPLTWVWPFVEENITVGNPDVPGKILQNPCAVSVNCTDEQRSLNLCDLGEVRGSGAFVMSIMLCQPQTLYLCAVTYKAGVWQTYLTDLVCYCLVCVATIMWCRVYGSFAT